jgi:hypothetical protein
MRLAYHKGKNVGDAINPIIFDHFLGREFFNEKDETYLLGIGSIIGLKGKLPGKKVVFSSGWGDDEATYGELPSIDSTWDIRALRGPLTADALKVSRSAAVLDGAYLIRRKWKRDCDPVPGRVGFIPHHKSLDFYTGWDRVCADSGLEFIDVRLDPREFMSQLWRCERVVTEAMHGAIFSDAYRIPWIPIRLYGHINEFKWQDWWASLCLDPCAHWAPTKLHSADFFADLLTQREFPGFLAPTLAKVVLVFRKRKMKRWLSQISSRESYLSDEVILDSLIEELLCRLDGMANDYKSCENPLF